MVERPTCESQDINDLRNRPLSGPDNFLELTSFEGTHRLPTLFVNLRSNLSTELSLDPQEVEAVHPPNIPNLKVEQVEQLLLRQLG